MHILRPPSLIGITFAHIYVSGPIDPHVERAMVDSGMLAKDGYTVHQYGPASDPTYMIELQAERGIATVDELVKRFKELVPNAEMQTV